LLEGLARTVDLSRWVAVVVANDVEDGFVEGADHA